MVKKKLFAKEFPWLSKHVNLGIDFDFKVQVVDEILLERKQLRYGDIFQDRNLMFMWVPVERIIILDKDGNSLGHVGLKIKMDRFRFLKPRTWLAWLLDWFHFENMNLCEETVGDAMLKKVQDLDDVGFVLSILPRAQRSSAPLVTVHKISNFSLVAWKNNLMAGVARTLSQA